MRATCSFQFWAEDEPKFVATVIESTAIDKRLMLVGWYARHCSTSFQMMFENATNSELDAIAAAMNAPFERQMRESAEEKKDDAA